MISHRLLRFNQLNAVSVVHGLAESVAAIRVSQSGRIARRIAPSHSDAKRPTLSGQAREAADKLFSAALALLDDRTDNLFGDWSIADVDLAMMLQRLIVLGDGVPQRLVDYATLQWRRPTVQQWIHRTRPPLVGY